MLLAVPAVASAAVFVVTTTADGNDSVCNSHCTLREAVLAAGGADSISVPAGTYVLTLGELPLTGDTLNGAGARSTIIDGANSSRVISVSVNGSASTISGVTVTRGNGVGQSASGNGGGIYATGGLTITNSHITGNTASSGGGIYMQSSSTLTLVGSTVAGNLAQTSSGSQGGGIYGGGEALLQLANSTISGNIARDTGPNTAQGGGIYAGNTASVVLANATVAGNEASTNNGGGVYLFSFGTGTFTNSIVADNTGGACAGAGAVAAASHHNVATDGTCTLTGPGNLQGVAALLGGLANNGGPTDTRALAANSPAVNAGSSCATSDQRGFARPQGAACDIGAFEYVAPTLTVTTTVTNNDGGEDGPGDFSVGVRDAAGANVAGSPQPGSASGTTYTLAPGSFTVAADGPNLYSLAIGGACAAGGAVTLGENQTATCTVTANDRAPVPGRSVGAIPARGTVRVKRPGGKFRVLREGDLLPNGTTIDTLRGRVTLIAAQNKRGKESKADFYDGVFKLRQSKGKKPITTLTLTEKLTCPKAGSASAAAKKKRKRRLWGNGSGRFRTKGKHSAATVVGTKWLVEDRCKSTLTRVVRGRVSVRDFVKKKTVIVRRGKRYVARAD
jgi:CSLREA domain-containing protein